MQFVKQRRLSRLRTLALVVLVVAAAEGLVLQRLICDLEARVRAPLLEGGRGLGRVGGHLREVGFESAMARLFRLRGF